MTTVQSALTRQSLAAAHLVTCPSLEVLLAWAATLGYEVAPVPRAGVR